MSEGTELQNNLFNKKKNGWELLNDEKRTVN